jgi:GTP-binding protein
VKDKDRLPEVLDAQYVAEAREASALPAEGPPEVAIAGRSNVGKSTLLNRLAGRRALARTSKTPGRTRGLILYDLALRFPGDAPGARHPLRLVDLPGYGYAQVSHEERKRWQTLVEGYVERRAALKLFLLLVDARRTSAGEEPLGAEEAQLVEYLESIGVRYRVVITKIDKLSAGERGAAASRLRGGPLLVSGETGEGLPALWRTVRAALTS